MANLQMSPSLAAATITECVIESVSGSGAALDPATVSLKLPLTLVASLPCFERLQPSADDGTVLLLAFSSNAEVEAAIGLAAWPAPTRKEPSRVLRVALLPEAAAAAVAVGDDARARVAKRVQPANSVDAVGGSIRPDLRQHSWARGTSRGLCCKRPGRARGELARLRTRVCETDPGRRSGRSKRPNRALLDGIRVRGARRPGRRLSQFSDFYDFYERRKLPMWVSYFPFLQVTFLHIKVHLKSNCHGFLRKNLVNFFRLDVT